MYVYLDLLVFDNLWCWNLESIPHAVDWNNISLPQRRDSVTVMALLMQKLFSVRLGITPGAHIVVFDNLPSTLSTVVFSASSEEAVDIGLTRTDALVGIEAISSAVMPATFKLRPVARLRPCNASLK